MFGCCIFFFNLCKKSVCIRPSASGSPQVKHWHLPVSLSVLFQSDRQKEQSSMTETDPSAVDGSGSGPVAPAGVLCHLHYKSRQPVLITMTDCWKPHHWVFWWRYLSKTVTRFTPRESTVNLLCFLQLDNETSDNVTMRPCTHFHISLLENDDAGKQHLRKTELKWHNLKIITSAVSLEVCRLNECTHTLF